MTESKRIYKELKQDVVTCTLAPGLSISEQEMCDRYKASRTPVREACRKLCEESLMQMVPFRGYSIPPLTIEEYRNLRELQAAVDPSVAVLAAERATPTQIKEIENWASYEYNVGQPNSYYTFLEWNRNFHICIAAATRNQAFLDVVKNVQTRLMRYYYQVIVMDSYGPELVAEHHELVRAIKSGNADLARKQAEEHLSNTARRSVNIDLRSVNFGVESLLGSEETDWLQQTAIAGTKLKNEFPYDDERYSPENRVEQTIANVRYRKFYWVTMMRVAIDTGGTFTDCVYLQDGKFVVLKVFSTPQDPGQAVLNGLRQIAAGPKIVVRHGTTVGTNTMLERKGARVAFVTTKGFEDTIAIGRQARPKLYDWFQPTPECLVPDGLRFGITERTSAECEIIREINPDELDALVTAIGKTGVEAVALSLLFSFANSKNESAVAAALERLGLPLSISHRILPEFREYERASTVVTNAYLAPKMGAYLTNLAKSVESGYEEARLEVMQSSGGIISAKLAAAEPVRTVLSGPAGGVIGAYKLATLAGFDRIIGFDMGGTSTDVCLVDASAGGLHISNESVVSGIPIGVPMLDIHTAGAGGGSIARFDAGGMLRVGPESAGATPGPICFGRGEQPTVTDANLALGRLGTERFLGGSVKLDRERMMQWMEKTKGPIATVEDFAAGILRVIETSMAKAIRVISVERGYDPRDFTLVAFGGGGPVHACSLAHALRVPRVLVPALPGALSAVGILLADTMREYSRTVMLPVDGSFEAVFSQLEKIGEEEFQAEKLTGQSFRSVDVRYQGQGYELNVPFGPEMAAQFHDLHQRRYGFSNEARPLEVVNVRVRMVSAADAFEPEMQPLQEGDGSHALIGTRPVYFDDGFHETRLYDRDLLRPGDTFAGPAIVSEYSSATILPLGDVLRVDGLGNLVIEVHE